MDNQNTQSQQANPMPRTPKIGSKGFLWTVGIIVVLAIVGGGYLIWASNQIATPSLIPVLGGDKDVHGCISSAGYSWCEAKNKCLRTWEESCNASLTADLTGWQTYKNEQFGFEFKYPGEWNLSTGNLEEYGVLIIKITPKIQRLKERAELVVTPVVTDNIEGIEAWEIKKFGNNEFDFAEIKVKNGVDNDWNLYYNTKESEGHTKHILFRLSFVNGLDLSESAIEPEMTILSNILSTFKFVDSQYSCTKNSDCAIFDSCAEFVGIVHPTGVSCEQVKYSPSVDKKYLESLEAQCAVNNAGLHVTYGKPSCINSSCMLGEVIDWGCEK